MSLFHKEGVIKNFVILFILFIFATLKEKSVLIVV